MKIETSRFAKTPGIGWALVHPRLAAWLVLSLGMVVLLVIEARDVGLLPGQWLALVAACVLVAGACVWIISWEDKDEASNGEAGKDKQPPAETTAADAAAPVDSTTPQA